MDAKEKLDAGADLVQIYTGFIYKGPSLVKKINLDLIKTIKNEKINTSFHHISIFNIFSKLGRYDARSI